MLNVYLKVLEAISISGFMKDQIVVCMICDKRFEVQDCVRDRGTFYCKSCYKKDPRFVALNQILICGFCKKEFRFKDGMKYKGEFFCSKCRKSHFKHLFPFTI